MGIHRTLCYVAAMTFSPNDTTVAFWNAYTAQVLAWRMGPARPEASFAAEAPHRARRAADRTVRVSAAGRRPYTLLLGAGDGTLAEMLRADLPPECHLLVLETTPCAARRLRSGHPDLLLLADTSPWALLFLLAGAGITPDQCAVCRNPAPDAYAPALDTWRRLFLGAHRHSLPAPCSVAISAACILHPDEPGLEDFFAHIPPWISELAVVWDTRVPTAMPPCPVPLRQSVRPLRGDFSAQRNAMLELCTGEWCLYLDADERLSPATWAALPRLAGLSDADSVLFPRLTFEGDDRHARMGYGLWPDVQQRFFRRTAQVRFTGAVHEKLTGLKGRAALAPGLPLLHYSHIAKDRSALAERLAVYNAATGGPVHRLNTAYPCLERATLEYFGALFGDTAVLSLPPLA